MCYETVERKLDQNFHLKKNTFSSPKQKEMKRDFMQ